MLDLPLPCSSVRFDFSEEKFQTLAQERYPHKKMKISVLQTTGSTNADLLMQARAGSLPEGESGQVRVLFAHSQQAGRGRLQRPWLSTAGQCLMMSVATTLNVPVSALEGLPVATGGVIAKVLEHYDVTVQIKWPNDLMVNRAKLGGILIESTPVSGTNRIGVVIGLGLNGRLDNATLMQLKHPAIDLSRLVKSEFSSLHLAIDLAAEITNLLTATDLSGKIAQIISTQVALRDACKGEVVQLIDPFHPHAPPIAQGVVLGLTKNGGLQLNTAEGVQIFLSGEISLRWV